MHVINVCMILYNRKKYIEKLELLYLKKKKIGVSREFIVQFIYAIEIGTWEIGR